MNSRKSLRTLRGRLPRRSNMSEMIPAPGVILGSPKPTTSIPWLVLAPRSPAFRPWSDMITILLRPPGFNFWSNRGINRFFTRPSDSIPSAARSRKVKWKFNSLSARGYAGGPTWQIATAIFFNRPSVGTRKGRSGICRHTWDRPSTSSIVPSSLYVCSATPTMSIRSSRAAIAIASRFSRVMPSVASAAMDRESGTSSAM